MTTYVQINPVLGKNVRGDSGGAEFELCQDVHQKHNADDNTRERFRDWQHRLVKPGKSRIHQFRFSLSHGTLPLVPCCTRSIRQPPSRQWPASRGLQQGIGPGEIEVGIQSAQQQI